MSLVSDPSILTKAKLKEELKKHNIKLPPSDSKKQTYVELYEKHLLRSNVSENAEEDTGFSSGGDELILNVSDSPESEEDSEIQFNFKKGRKEQSETANNKSARSACTSDNVTKKANKDKSAKGKNKPDMEIEEIADMTDMQLAEELKNYGVSPGPITSTTRSVYEKKLLKLMKSDKAEEILNRSKPKYTEVPDDEDRLPPVKPRSPKLRKRIVRPPPPEELEDTSEGPEVSEIEREDVTSPDPPQQTEEPQTSSGGISKLVKLFIFLIVLFFVYLVYINMEPSGSRIPKIKGNK